MNHKLHNTILASAVVGATLLFVLLAARPIAGHASATHAPVRPAASMIAVEIHSDVARDMDRHARRLEADLATSGSAAEALTMASALLATSVMQATLATLEEATHRPPQARPPSTTVDETQRARAARNRSAMAMPYFSTARTMRRGNVE